MSKIFITGTSGIGKTTLAQYIALKRRIPFVNGSSTVLWKNYGINNHKELLQMGISNPQKGLEFQYDLLGYREQAVSGLDSFVTDRTPVDNLVYFLYQNAPYLSSGEVEEYIKACKTSFNHISGIHEGDLKLIYLTRDFFYGDSMELENDNKRIDNHYYQDMMDNLFQHVFDMNYLELNLDSFNYRRYREYNWESRIDLTDMFLKKKRNRIEQTLHNWL